MGAAGDGATRVMAGTGEAGSFKDVRGAGTGAGSGAAGSRFVWSGDAHCPQNLAAAPTVDLQTGQRRGNAAPHSSQNIPFAELGVPHSEQVNALILPQ